MSSEKTPPAEKIAETSKITSWLAHAKPSYFAAYAIAASFSAYFCMYAYRKAFAAAGFKGALILGLDAKTVFVIAQVLGYAASKFLGIKVVSELGHAKRARSILLSIGLAELSLVAFALLPRSLAPLAMVVNGLSLGMIWGMVFGFLEGRRTSDALGAGLCASFILASGAAKAGGKALLNQGVPEMWMPALVGLIVAPAMLLFVFLLSRIPPPSAADVAVRTERVPMDGAARTVFFKTYAPGLVLLVAAYVLLTAFRDFRDNFATEIWDALGKKDAPEILVTAEIVVAVGSLLGVALVGLVGSNRRALLAIHGVLVFGAALVGLATMLFRAGAIGPVTWMIAIGLGLYLAYVPYNCVLFDRLVAAVGSKANAGFLIYVADASGYAGSVATLLYKNLGSAELSWVAFLEAFGLVTSISVIACIVGSALYFRRRLEPA